MAGGCLHRDLRLSGFELKQTKARAKLTSQVLAARAQAYLEAAEHLGLAWTDDSVEWEQGQLVAQWLEREADRLLAKAQQRQAEGC